jgi:hypothetical protein
MQKMISARIQQHVCSTPGQQHRLYSSLTLLCLRVGDCKPRLISESSTMAAASPEADL